MDISVTAGNPVGYAIITGVIIAITQGLKIHVPQITGSVTILVAAIIGGLIGLFQFDGINVVTGIALGLAAVGANTVSQNVGGKTNATPIVTPVNNTIITTPNAPATTTTPASTTTIYADGTSGGASSGSGTLTGA